MTIDRVGALALFVDLALRPLDNLFALACERQLAGASITAAGPHLGEALWAGQNAHVVLEKVAVLAAGRHASEILRIQGRDACNCDVALDGVGMVGAAGARAARELKALVDVGTSLALECAHADTVSEKPSQVAARTRCVPQRDGAVEACWVRTLAGLVCGHVLKVHAAKRRDARAVESGRANLDAVGGASLRLDAGSLVDILGVAALRAADLAVVQESAREAVWVHAGTL